MELLDVYDNFRNFIGSYPRDIVHKEGLWHNTVHCWLYDVEGNVYFQMRKDLNKLYTSASGHVGSGEQLDLAVAREVKEELGIELDKNNCRFVGTVIWTSKEMRNGKPFIDNAYANVFLFQIDNKTKFKFGEDEVLGLVKFKARDVISLFQNKLKEIKGLYLDEKMNTLEKEYQVDDFLMNKDIFMKKYGFVLDLIKEC